MLDAVIELMPSPQDVPAIDGVDEKGQPAERHPGDDEPFSALAFKLMTDPYVGQLTFIRVYSGTGKATRFTTRSKVRKNASGVLC